MLGDIGFRRRVGERRHLTSRNAVRVQERKVEFVRFRIAADLQLFVVVMDRVTHGAVKPLGIRFLQYA